MTESNFRKLGHLEGFSLLILLFIAMPLKYCFDWPLMVRIVGSLHGGLFTIYIILGLLLVKNSNWTLRKLALAVVITIVPFGPFIFDKKLFPNS